MRPERKALAGRPYQPLSETCVASLQHASKSLASRLPFFLPAEPCICVAHIPSRTRAENLFCTSGAVPAILNFVMTNFGGVISTLAFIANAMTYFPFRALAHSQTTSTIEAFGDAAGFATTRLAGGVGRVRFVWLPRSRALAPVQLAQRSLMPRIAWPGAAGHATAGFLVATALEKRDAGLAVLRELTLASAYALPNAGTAHARIRSFFHGQAFLMLRELAVDHRQITYVTDRHTIGSMVEFTEEKTPVDPVPDPASKANLDMVREDHERVKLRIAALEARVAALEEDPSKRLVQKAIDYVRAFLREIDARPSLSEPGPPRSGGSRPPR